MIKVEVIEDFTLKEFTKVQDLKRGSGRDKEGCLYVGDTFNCDQGLCEYLMGGNALGKTVVQLLEVDPEVKEVKKVESATKEVLEKVEKEKPKAKKKKSK